METDIAAMKEGDRRVTGDGRRESGTVTTDGRGRVRQGEGRAAGKRGRKETLIQGDQEAGNNGTAAGR